MNQRILSECERLMLEDPEVCENLVRESRRRRVELPMRPEDTAVPITIMDAAFCATALCAESSDSHLRQVIETTIQDRLKTLFGRDDGLLTHRAAKEVVGDWVEESSRVIYNTWTEGASSLLETLDEFTADKFCLHVDFWTDQEIEKALEKTRAIGASVCLCCSTCGGAFASGLRDKKILKQADAVVISLAGGMNGNGGVILFGAVECQRRKYLDTDLRWLVQQAVCLGEAEQERFAKNQLRAQNDARELALHLTIKGFRVECAPQAPSVLLRIDPNLRGELYNNLRNVGIVCHQSDCGLAFCTAAIAARGVGTGEMKEIAEIISLVFQNCEKERDSLREWVREIAEAYPACR